MKQIKTWLTTIAALLCSLTASAYDFMVGGIYYNITSDADLTVEVTCKGLGGFGDTDCYEGAVTIPTSVTYLKKVYRVTSIGPFAFQGCDLTSLTIPESVERIKDRAFERVGIKSLTIPEGVDVIERDAFHECWIESLTLPESVRSIEEGAFCYSKLTHVYIPINSQLETIDSEIFRGCNNLITITIPKNVKRISGDAFYDCDNLKRILNLSKAPYSGLKVINGCDWITIGDYQFYSSNDVHYLANYIGNECDIVLPEGYKGESYQIGRYAFCGYSNLTSITIPENLQLTGIGEYAFYSCRGFTSITIPESVTSIGDLAFSGCNITSITIPENSQLTGIGNYAFNGCDLLTSIAIPNSVTSIGKGAFDGCSSLTSITIPESVTSIGDYAFLGCDNLNEIILKDGSKPLRLTTESFSCPLEKVFLGRNLEYDATTGNSPFSGRRTLTSVIVGDSVTSLGYHFFYDCKNLKYAIIGDGISEITSAMFGGCFALTELTLGRGLKEISSNQFSSAESLRKITILAEQPPVIREDDDTFLSYTYEYATLYVPRGSMSKYQEMEGWRRFDNISTIPASAITLSQTSATLTEGDSIRLTATVLPETMANQSVVWSSSNDTVAIVDSTGNITAIAPGTITITATAADESGVSESCEVTVLPAKYVITFLVDGEVYATDTLAHGTPINMAKEPTKEGYIFCGLGEIPEVMPAQDITISGTFIINKYLVTFKIGDDVIAADSLEYGAAIVVPEAPEKEGYTFNGWKQPANVTSFIVNNNFDPSKGDKTHGVVEGWVTGAMNGYEQNTITYSRSAFNLYQELEGLTPGVYEVTVYSYYRAGSYLNEWKLYQQDPAKAHRTILYAETTHKKNEIKVMNILEGASDDSYDVDCYPLPNGKFIPAGTSSSVKFFDEGHYLNKLRFVVGEDGKARIGLEKTEPGINDFQMVGEWNLYSYEIGVAETVPASDVTYEGTYTVNIYKVYYYVGEELVHTAEVAYGEAIPEYVYEPAEEGYTFLGWVGDTYETMPAHDVTYTANIDNGIEHSTLNPQRSTIYDLSGRKIEIGDLRELRKGIYIGNGQKMIIK